MMIKHIFIRWSLIYKRILYRRGLVDHAETYEYIDID